MFFSLLSRQAGDQTERLQGSTNGSGEEGGREEQDFGSFYTDRSEVAWVVSPCLVATHGYIALL